MIDYLSRSFRSLVQCHLMRLILIYFKFVGGTGELVDQAAAGMNIVGVYLSFSLNTRALSPFLEATFSSHKIKAMDHSVKKTQQIVRRME